MRERNAYGVGMWQGLSMWNLDLLNPTVCYVVLILIFNNFF